MRYFSKFISAALMLILAVACNTKEIDNPDNPDKPQISDNIKIAASIKQTRVSYSVDNNKLVPDWEKDDVIFGYYGTGDGRIVFTVTGVDETTGIASLAASGPDWEDFLAEYKTAGKDLKVGLIYTGTKETDKDILFENENAVSVAMTSQTGENIPACMHATSFVPDKDDEGQIIRFLFDNDCAIFEIESLTGIAEDSGLTNVQTLSLTSLTITNLIPTYEYSYASGALSYNSGTGDPTSYTINLPKDAWKVDYEGNINHSVDKNLLVAVAPNSENNILITATTEGGRQFSYLYYGKLDAGECYIIKKRDVVAKTEDGQYFTSVSGAFDHASTLVSTFGENNKVTLVNELIYGLNEDDVAHATTYYDPTIIDINYSVILDLNGCTLSLDCLENNADVDTFHRPFDWYYGGGFDVWTNGTLTIIDEEDIGYIDSCSECPIINNSGTVNIEGGNLCHWYGHRDNVIYSTGELNVSGGNLYAYASPAVILYDSGAVGNITGGLIENDNDNGSDEFLTAYETIEVLDGAKCTISGGVIHSYGDSPTIGCRSVSPKISSLTITWPTSQDDAKTDKEYGEYIHEPLIYAAAPNSYSTDGFNNVPISAYDASANSSAVVSLQGGYLISNPNLETFFSGDGTSANNYINLDFNNNVGFYSNKEKITWQGSGNGNKKDLYNKGSGQVIQKGTPPLKAYATFQGENSSFTMPIINVESGNLWYIYK